MSQLEKIEFSPVSRAIRLLLNIIIIWVFGYLSYGWSFSETREFNVLIFGTKYAAAAALVFQVGPNAILALRQVTSGKLMTVLVWSFVIGLNVIDFITNGGQFYQWWVTRSAELMNQYHIHPYVVLAAFIVGWIFCFAVTWFEEILLYLMGVSFHLIGLLSSDLGVTAIPNWLLIDLSSVAIAAAGGQPMQQKQKQKQQQKQQPPIQQSRPRQQPPNIHQSDLQHPIMPDINNQQ